MPIEPPHLLTPELLRAALVTLGALLILLAAAIAIGDERRRRSIIVRPWWRP